MDELKTGLSFVDVDVVARAFDLCDARVRKLVCVHLIIISDAERAVQKVGEAWVPVLSFRALRVADNVIDVGHDGVDIDGPLDCLVVVSIRVNQVVRDEVGDAHVRELRFDNVNGFFARLANDVKVSDLLYALQGHLLLLWLSRSGCRVETDYSTDVVRVQSRGHHRRLGSQVVADQRVPFESAALCKPGNVACHLFVTHTLMMVALPVVAQVDKEHITLLGDDIVQGEVSPHSTLAEQPMEEQNRGGAGTHRGRCVCCW